MRKLLLIKKVAIISLMAFLFVWSAIAQEKTVVAYIYSGSMQRLSGSEVASDSLLSEHPTMQMFIDDGYEVDSILVFDISATTATTDSLIEVLNDADLVYIGRQVGSSFFDPTVTGTVPRNTLWNSITAPIMTGNMWALRGGEGTNIRLKWFNTETIFANTAVEDSAILEATILEPDDDVFEGLDLAASVGWWYGSHNIIDPTGGDAGNGIVMATAAGGKPIFVRFEEGDEFYSGSVEMPEAERVYFGLDCERENTYQYYSRYTELAKEVFLREAARLSGHIREGNVGIEKKDFVTSKVFMNQSTKQLTVEMDNLMKLDVIDITGRQIYSSSVNSDKLTIDLSFATSGIYIVKSTNSNYQFAISKIIKR